MAQPLVRGLQNTPLPNTAVVLRAAKLPPDYEAGRPLSREAFNFSLSQRDKEQPLPLLSVYAEELTTPEQVRTLVGDGVSYCVIARLPVQEIRQIEVEGHRLNVVWDDAVLDDGNPDTRPGSEGHAGIAGLQRPPNVPKALFKTLQVRLADLASLSPVILESSS